VSGASVDFEIIADGTCGDVTDNNNGTYNCTYTPISGGWKNLTMNSSKTYYSDGYYFKENAFQIRRTPEISSYDITPQTGGWGSNYIASVSISIPWEC
jgi:hypothetical protein